MNELKNEKPYEDDVNSGDDSDNEKPNRRSGRRKIKIEYIEDKNRRHITFSKRKAGIMKKAYELSTLTGTQVLLLVVSETGLVYTFTTVKLQPIVTKPEGKNLIQQCLNSPDPVPESSTSADAPYNNMEDKKVPYDNNINVEPVSPSPVAGNQAYPAHHQATASHYPPHHQAAPQRQMPGANNGYHPGYMNQHYSQQQQQQQQQPQQQQQQQQQQQAQQSQQQPSAPQPYGQMPPPSSFYGNHPAQQAPHHYIPPPQHPVGYWPNPPSSGQPGRSDPNDKRRESLLYKK
ncbi:uncharacterized protein BYT42DRAFT_20902 [Radiomyces spectabilis]|uniref:uncharacterized protein n=1 Tax=Radiomyces spectabilis TaxID=64574 RepID=UPI00222003DC|nr:uncharacterized protein BYT42DRAFT_20902 [Radiomyces spectabilis]KAI8393843.1 hypothetical protein BYT42DRAFT_20902 [Radiomyces spectabilis]